MRPGKFSGLIDHPKLAEALQKNATANKKIESLPSSRQKEIARYINQLKSGEAVERNIARAINFLLGKEGLIGRDQP